MKERQDATAHGAVPGIIPLRVFLCHSSEDKGHARELYRRLRSSGVQPWLDEFDLLPGQEWDREIGSAVKASDVVLICLSSTSVNKTGYIQREIRYALDVADRQPDGSVFIIPARLEDCGVPDRLNQWHWVNLFEPDGYDRLIVSLTNRCKVLERLTPRTFSETDKWLASVFSALNPGFTFENFIVGPTNQLAYAGASSVVIDPARAYNPLFIYGGVGTGKTHLLHAVARGLIDRHQGVRVIYRSAERFSNDVVTSVRLDGMVQFRDRYRSVDILLIDDIQLLGHRERTQEEFFYTFCELHDRQKQIVVASDSSPREITGLVERLRSRLESGLVVQIQPPDLETKMAILERKANNLGLYLPPEVGTYVAQKTKSNVRDMEGALAKVAAYSSFGETPISLRLAQELLDEGRRVNIDAIQEAVAAKFGIKKARLREKSNLKEIVVPRQVAMYLANKLTDASLPEIGRAFGGKHHTTVIHSISKIDQLMKTDGDLNRLINGIGDSLQ